MFDIWWIALIALVFLFFTVIQDVRKEMGVMRERLRQTITIEEFEQRLRAPSAPRETSSTL